MKDDSAALGRISADLVTQLEAATQTKVMLHSLRPFGDGHSGFTYSAVLESGGEAHRRIIRLSPPGVRIAGPADVGRQGRIMKALHAAGLPSPAVIACGSDPVIDGRSYAVLALVDGTDWEAAAAAHSSRAVAEAAAAFLARLQTLPVVRTGIGDEKPVSPREEVERWAKLLHHGESDVYEPGTRLVAQLLGDPPELGEPVLVHGDFHYANMLFGPVGAIVAVVDWEIAQLGYRLLDFGCLAVAGLRRRYAPEPNPTGSLQVPLAELAEINGVAPAEAAWATAAACLKYAAILAYNLKLHRQGKRLDPVYEELQGTMLGLLQDGSEMLRAGSPEPFAALT